MDSEQLHFFLIKTESEKNPTAIASISFSFLKACIECFIDTLKKSIETKK